MELGLYSRFKELFDYIINNNDYYENIKKEYKKDNFIVSTLVNDYGERQHISIYDYLDTIEDYMKEHNEDVIGAIEMLDNFGGWHY